jgi:DNA mismatch repair protein PMS2
MLRGLFVPLPVRRKEFERHVKREFGKVLTLISAYALVPCSQENGGVKLTLVQVSETG